MRGKRLDGSAVSSTCLTASASGRYAAGARSGHVLALTALCGRTASRRALLVCGECWAFMAMGDIVPAVSAVSAVSVHGVPAGCAPSSAVVTGCGGVDIRTSEVASAFPQYSSSISLVVSPAAEAPMGEVEGKNAWVEAAARCASCPTSTKPCPCPIFAPARQHQWESGERQREGGSRKRQHEGESGERQHEGESRERQHEGESRERQNEEGSRERQDEWESRERQHEKSPGSVNVIGSQGSVNMKGGPGSINNPIK